MYTISTYFITLKFKYNQYDYNYVISSQIVIIEKLNFNLKKNFLFTKHPLKIVQAYLH